MKYSAPLTLAGYDLSKREKILFFLTHPAWVKYRPEWKQTLKQDKKPLDLKMPWFTYGAIDWLQKNLKPGCRIFEYGTGGSTLFFSSYASELVSVEHNEEWYKQVLDLTAGNSHVKLLYKEPIAVQTGEPNYFPSETFAEYKDYSFENYVKAIDSYPDNYFDVISVDGRCRCACLTAGIKKLKPGGILIIDNSERAVYHDAMAQLKGFQRYDFDGFGPALTTFWQTTVFIKPCDEDIVVSPPVSKNDDKIEVIEVTPLDDDFSMYVTPGVAPYYTEGYERFTTKIVKNFTNRCDLLIDAGADFGYYSLLTGHANRTSGIIAIEPAKIIFDVLNKNLLHNKLSPGRARCINAAVAAVSGNIRFSQSEAGGVDHHVSDSLDELNIDTISLDDVLRDEHYKSLFVRLDVDGNELEALKGLGSTLGKCTDIVILLETSHAMLRFAEIPHEGIFDYLSSRDFILYAIDDKEHRFYPIEKETNLNMICERGGVSYFNVLCVKKSKALSVALFSHSPEMGGAERSLLDLARGLSLQGILCTAVIPADGALAAAFRNLGCAVYVPILTGEKNAWWWCLNIGSESKSAVAAFGETVREQIVPELKKQSPDVIVSQTIVSPWGAVCAGLLNLPHVLSAREYGELDHHLIFLFGFKESIAALYDSSNAVFCITKDVRDVLFGQDAGQKTSVIYSNIQIEQADSSRTEDWNAALESGVTVGIFGTIAENKGQEDLVRAVIALCQQGLKIKCLMAGGISSNAYLEKLDRLIEESGYAEQFERYPFSQDCCRLMKKADIIVSCSRKEALGRTLLEAALLGKPIIYSNDGGPKEIFISGTHGLAYDAGDCVALSENIIRTITDKPATRRRIAATREYVLHTFSASRYAGKVAEKLLDLKGLKTETNRSNAVIALINNEAISFLRDENNRLSLHAADLRDENNRLSLRAAELLKLYNDDQQYKSELLGLIHQFEDDNKNLRTNIAHLARQFDSINSAASWKMTKPLRVTLDKMKEIKELDKALFLMKKSIKSIMKYGMLKSFSNFRNKMSLYPAGRNNNLELFETVRASFAFTQPAGQPDVSIIVPVYNHFDYTIKCLYAILQNTPGVTYEVIIADDNSSDNTRVIEKTVKNIIYIRNKTNLGFLKNCNNAVEYCKGRYILFLNNDTIPQQNWLKPLVDFMENNPLTGGIGSKLIFPDGTMQEAGSIIWNDGSCRGYGRGDAPGKPEYSFVREVDYCSGASIMFRRTQFIELGKFDEIYAPAYYEEADFCMTLRKNGYKVMLIPQSVVVHCEFVSSTSSKGIELQLNNRQLFIDKWHYELTAHYPPLDTNIIHARSRSGRRRAMIIDDIIPDTSLGSGFPRSAHILDILCGIMDITYCQTDPNRVLDYETINKYQQTGVEIFAINYFEQAWHIKSILESRKGYYDFIFISRDHNMLLFNQIQDEIYKGARVIYDAEAITACRDIIQKELSGVKVSQAEADNLILKEVSLALKADAVIAVSENERQVFRQYGCNNVYVLGHAITATPGDTAFAGRAGLLFVGRIEESGENPNYDSLLYFINNIFDKILSAIPSIKLHIVGLCLSPTLGKISNRNIIFHGRVAETKPFYDQCRVFIAPTRFAAGIPFKLHEAAGRGIPSVATPLLAGQLGWSHGVELLTAATAEEFADNVIHLYSNPELWETVRNNALERVIHDCSQQLFKNTILSIINSIDQSHKQLYK